MKKDGSIDYSIKSPHEDDWGLLKIRTEQDLREKGMTVGQYIYDSLLNKPSQKIRGGLVRVVERSFYKDELKKLRHEVDYMKQEIEFLKKISSIRNTGK